MPFPNHPPVTLGQTALAGGVVARQALAPGGAPGPIMVNSTTNNTALVPGGSYMNGA